MLSDGDFTCVLCDGDTVLTSDERGVKPLLSWLKSGGDFSRFSAADKVVGKAAAFLYVLLGVRSVYAHVMSRPAYAVLCENGIGAEYNVLADAIFNRDRSGFCPMESAVLGIDSPDSALDAIERRLAEMGKG